MRTAIEVARDGATPLRVYHHAGTTMVDGVRVEARYSWTHPLAERDTCDACSRGTIPTDVKNGERSCV